MVNRNDLKVGDIVVISPENQYELYKIVPVTKITKTQVTAGDGRYMKSTGLKLGGSYDRWSSYYRPRILDKSIKDAMDENDKITTQLYKRKLARRLHSNGCSDWLTMPVEILERLTAIVDEFEANV